MADKLQHLSLTSLGKHPNAEAAFKAAALAGGFGDIDPSHQGGLDLSGLSDEQRAAVDKAIADAKPAVEEPAKKA